MHKYRNKHPAKPNFAKHLLETNHHLALNIRALYMIYAHY